MKRPEHCVHLDKEVIRTLIIGSKCETDAVVGIFRLVFPDFDDIEETEGYTVSTKQTWKDICRWFMDLTNELNKARAIDKQVMPAGAWMNWGFSCADVPENLPDWWVIPAPVTLKAKETATP